eukprot:scaffold7522_cov202-Skeletonema_marinoi.AAC.5
MNTNDVRSKNRREELIVQSIYPFFLPHQAQHSIAIRSDADKGSGSGSGSGAARSNKAGFILKLVLNICSNSTKRAQYKQVASLMTYHKKCPKSVKENEKEKGAF